MLRIRYSNSFYSALRFLHDYIFSLSVLFVFLPVWLKYDIPIQVKSESRCFLEETVVHHFVFAAFKKILH